MTKQHPLTATVAALALASSADAQIDTYYGASNNAGTVVDFDNPPATLGPIASDDPYLTSRGVREVNILGTWATGLSDVLEVYFDGQCLAVLDNQLTVSEFEDRIDEPTAGAGLEIVFTEALVSSCDSREWCSCWLAARTAMKAILIRSTSQPDRESGTQLGKVPPVARK